MGEMFKNKQILYLFISSFAVLFTGMGLFPILPLFAARFDASNSTTGFFLAIIYAANTLGPIVTGWLITRFPRKTLFVIGGAVGLPALVGLSAAQNFTQVIVLTSLLWFSGGVVMALVSILTGLHTSEHSRGKAFSLMAMVGPLGSLAGGAAVGQLVAWQGYAVMFIVLAVAWAVIPLIGLIFLKEGPQGKAHGSVSRAGTGGKSQEMVPERFGSAFIRTMALTFLGSIAVNVSRFGSSLSMQSMMYAPETVSMVAMVSGLAAIPVTLLVGAVSDRLGRKHILFTSYLFATSGSLILIGATEFWQYSAASILHMLAYSISGAMAQALASEVVPSSAVSRSLSWLSALGSIASIVCFAMGGILYDLLSMEVFFLAAAEMALAAGGGIEILVRVNRKAASKEDFNKVAVRSGSAD